MQGNVDCVAWSPDGQKLATGSTTGVRLWEPISGRLLEDFPSANPWNRSVSWNPVDGRLAAVGTGSIRVWDFNKSRDPIQLPTSVPDELMYSLAWSTDGAWLATGSAQWTVSLWNDDSIKSGKPHSLWTVGLYSRTLSWSADGQWLASPGSIEQGSAIRLWDVDKQMPGPDLRGHVDDVCGVSFSPDSSRLVSSGFDATVRVWNMKTQKPARISVALPNAKAATFTPAGQLLTDIGAAGDGLVYIVESEDGSLDLLKPSEFQKLVTQPRQSEASRADLSPDTDPRVAEDVLSVGGSI